MIPTIGARRVARHVSSFQAKPSSPRLKIRSKIIHHAIQCILARLLTRTAPRHESFAPLIMPTALLSRTRRPVEREGATSAEAIVSSLPVALTCPPRPALPSSKRILLLAPSHFQVLSSRDTSKVQKLQARLRASRIGK